MIFRICIINFNYDLYNLIPILWVSKGNKNIKLHTYISGLWKIVFIIKDYLNLCVI